MEIIKIDELSPVLTGITVAGAFTGFASALIALKVFGLAYTAPLSIVFIATALLIGGVAAKLIGHAPARETSPPQLAPNAIIPKKLSFEPPPYATDIANIEIPLATLPAISLKEGLISDEDLAKLFEFANAASIEIPYALADHPSAKRFNQFERKQGDSVIYRPNHNGTHSARQAAYAEYLFEKIPELKASFTPLERQLILISSYFLRSGRVDESGFADGDTHKVRSAGLFEAYVSQIEGISSEMIEWAKKLILVSCKPINLIEQEDRECIDINDKKNNLAYWIHYLVHNNDLYRCNQSSEYVQGEVIIGLSALGSKIGSIDAFALTGELKGIAEKLFAATGQGGDFDTFYANSKSGKVCWENVQKALEPGNLEGS